MDKNTYNLLYNISKTLSEDGEFCSKNGCSFNSDFLNNDDSSFQKKPDQTAEQKQPDHNEPKEDEPNFGSDEFHRPVLGSNLVSGKN